MSAADNREAGHTPLPWLRDQNLVYALDATGTRKRFSAGVQGGWAEYLRSHVSEAEVDANAEFIVHACNSHYALLEALKGLSSWWEVALIGWDDLPFPDVFRERVEKARAAITLATTPPATLSEPEGEVM